MPSILITGVSSGMGHALAALACEKGWSVIGTVRPGKEDLAPEVVGECGAVEVKNLELADFRDVRRLARGVLDEHGCPDVLVNNAGYLMFGPVEETETEAMRRQFDVNVFGQIELIKLFLAPMRERGSGIIVNVTSLGGRLVFPFFASYNASKHALEGFSEGLWHELKPFGIKVKVIEPGYVQTELYREEGADDPSVVAGPEAGAEADAEAEPYARLTESAGGFFDSITKRSTPEEAAAEMWAAINDKSDKLRYPIAESAKSVLRARRWLGEMRLMRYMHRRILGSGE
jgi:NAD(P)-dependent dehydrogenase (short-subunit alcohol dehydrogenase family)